MILYTQVPWEQVMGGLEHDVKPSQEIQIDGLLMEVQPLDNKRAQIVRLIHPDPNMYLNPRYAPGTVIIYQPSLTDDN